MNDNRKNLLKGYNLLLYFAGSMILSEPTEECIIDFWKNKTLKKLPVTSSNPRFIKAAGLLRESCSDTINCSEILAKDYSLLFAGNGPRLAPAYESNYLSEEDKSKGEVGQFYANYGWKSRLNNKIPDDHLGIEILFLTKLIDKYLILDDDPCCCEMRNEICRFIDNHILSWVPGWYKDVEENAVSICYKGIGLLIYACAEDLKAIFSSDKEIRN